MSAKRFFESSCTHCGWVIEFPVESIGLTVACPHCAQITELSLAFPVSASPRPAHGLKWMVAGLVILAVGMAGVTGAFFMAQRLAKRTRGSSSLPAAIDDAHKSRATVTNTEVAPLSR